jgi:hypothetical protein
MVTPAVVIRIFDWDDRVRAAKQGCSRHDASRFPSSQFNLGHLTGRNIGDDREQDGFIGARIGHIFCPDSKTIHA